MTDTLKTQIQEDMKSALRAGEKSRLSTIRLLLSAIKQREIDERVEWTDASVLALIDKMIKQRQESIKQYQAAHRADLAEQEQREIEVLQAYLPPALSADEINTAIRQAVSEAGATSAKDMGKVMTLLKPKLQGRADMARVSEQVKQHLQS